MIILPSSVHERDRQSCLSRYWKRIFPLIQHMTNNLAKLKTHKSICRYDIWFVLFCVKTDSLIQSDLHDSSALLHAQLMKRAKSQRLFPKGTWLAYLWRIKCCVITFSVFKISWRRVNIWMETISICVLHQTLEQHHKVVLLQWGIMSRAYICGSIFLSKEACNRATV